MITNSYEPHRNLQINVENEYETGVVSQYGYVYNNIGCRTSVDYSANDL